MRGDFNGDFNSGFKDGFKDGFIDGLNVSVPYNKDQAQTNIGD